MASVSCAVQWGEVSSAPEKVTVETKWCFRDDTDSTCGRDRSREKPEPAVREVVVEEVGSERQGRNRRG